MKKIIFFQVHPDDLEFNCYHLLYYLGITRKGKYDVKIASLSRGEYGWPKHGEHFKGERLGRMRTQELYNAMSTYGIPPEKIHFFEVIDGRIYFNREIIKLVKDYLNKEQPDIIFACEPRNTYYRHPDHMNIGKIIYYILDKEEINFRAKNTKLYFFNSIDPNFYWPFKKEAIPLAYKNMYVHKSQMHIWNSVGRFYKLMVRWYGSRIKGWKYAEGYKRIFYGNEKGKNPELKFSGRLFLTLLVKSWPEIVTRF